MISIRNVEDQQKRSNLTDLLVIHINIDYLIFSVGF